MSITADMIIFHEPDILEFAGNGKHLGRLKIYYADSLFNQVKNALPTNRKQLIQNIYDQFIGEGYV